ncbi:Hypothetical protein SRAE_X000182700 [Strongyloides ratti]|uniref:Uncharacterized protein n=1 Tax=Strongyloides ratti TaxID=34506 RepID=A0A090MPN8_STRRB|nr:Hypothetical protein SRAE_X000182700 [Strongyloides ratti]CEF60087.1 Hypothetical protein SRAE_X000182700 [Strongyloides ratti]
MSFTKNAEAEILANLGILSNHNSSTKDVNKDSVNDIKDTTNRTRLLSSSDNDKLSLNFDSDDDTMIVFNNSNSSQNNYLNKIIRMSRWQSYLIGLPIILFMNYLIGLFHLSPQIYKEEFYGFWTALCFGVLIGCDSYISVIIIYIFVIAFLTNVFYFTKGALLILISSSNDSKTLFLIYFFIALGSLIAPIALSNSLIHVTNLEIKTQKLFTKRDVSTFMETNNVIKSTINPTLAKNISLTNNIATTTNINFNKTTKISKPDSVIGVVENQDKKTEENLLQRAEAEEKRKKNVSESQLITTSTQTSTKSELLKGEVNQETEEIITDSTIESDKTTSKEIMEEKTSLTTRMEAKQYVTTKSPKYTQMNKVTKKVSISSVDSGSISPAPYYLKVSVTIGKTNLLAISLGIIIVVILPSLFFELSHILNIKKLPNDTLLKYMESKTYSSLPIKGIILSYIIWSILSIIECTFAYCQINRIENFNERSLLQATPIFTLLLVRFIAIFYCNNFVKKKMIHIIQIMSIGFIGIILYMFSNFKWSFSDETNNQMISEYLIGILGFLLGCIGPMYFSWISKMVQKHTLNLLNYFILTQIGSVIVVNVLYNYLLKNTDEGRMENTLYIILMLLVILEICFVFLSLHLSSYYRQTEIARLTNSLSGNIRKENNDIKVKIKKNKYGYNRLINDAEVNYESLICTDSDSNDEIFG